MRAHSDRLVGQAHSISSHVVHQQHPPSTHVPSRRSQHSTRPRSNQPAAHRPAVVFHFSFPLSPKKRFLNVSICMDFVVVDPMVALISKSELVGIAFTITCRKGTLSSFFISAWIVFLYFYKNIGRIVYKISTGQLLKKLQMHIIHHDEFQVL